MTAMWSRPIWLPEPLNGFSHDAVDPSAAIHVPPDWADAAERMQRDGVRSALVIGGVDVGKSTLCRFLLHRAKQAGRSAALLDTDVGQKMIGPPACVTLSDARGVRLSFVGTTNPVLGWQRLIDGVRRLADATDADFLLANTSGFLAGPGRRLKAAKIEALRPDLLLAVGGGPDLDAILRDHSQMPFLVLSRSPEARRKTDGERRSARREAFREYFAEASVATFARERLPGGRYPAGLLVGLSDERGTDLGLGILLGYASTAAVEILTPDTARDIRQVTPGSICLGQDFSETRLRLEGGQ